MDEDDYEYEFSVLSMRPFKNVGLPSPNLMRMLSTVNSYLYSSPSFDLKVPQNPDSDLKEHALHYAN